MRFALFPVAVAALALYAVTPAAFAADAAIHVAGAWCRPVPAGLPTGAVYLTAANSGRTADRLIGAQTPVAARMTLHRSTLADGMMSMAPVPGGAVIPAGGVLKIEPGGYHFMLEGLKGALQPGSTFPATLTFAHAGQIRVEVQVRAAPMAAGGMNMR